MKLSIVTINYNNQDGLRETMESVFSQSCQDFEYIVIDGASTDGSVDVIREFDSFNVQRSTLNVFTWVSEPDTGIYNAMNKGISMAHGEYLLFLNSGDYLVKDDVLSKVFENNPETDIVACEARFSHNGEIIHILKPTPGTTYGCIHLSGYNHQATFIKKRLFENFGLYDESFRWFADNEFFYRAIILNDATVEVLPILTTDYNTEGISSIENRTPEFNYERIWRTRHPVYKHFESDYIQYSALIDEFEWIRKKHPLLRKILRKYRKFIGEYEKPWWDKIK